ncbi:MAG TPA: spherulation-specific family 4 protein [Solirubrobacter sp.]|nr:spherulation-specific family 4 protein [Solirubrobacter sp.]
MSAAAGTPRTACGRALVPAYGGADTIAALAEQHGRGSILILNPQNGPGAARDPAYAAAVAAARRAGWRVIGYVATGYGTQPAAAVEAAAHEYAAWYGVDGIFLDEAAHDAAQLPYYRALRAAVPGLLVLNPGVVPDPGYAAVADLIVTYEGALDGAPAPAAGPHEARLVYAADEPGALAYVRSQPGGHLYVTAGALPDPWSALPAYLSAELAALSSCGAHP